MEYILLFILIVIAVVSYLIHKKNMELLRMVHHRTEEHILREGL